ncbi:hypothetical protein BDZ88DRAFT_395165 [Geranomyces variabilis]|nr:hypothetical protein BDZ88DRAFT_395165 [Geranomyces variabilis]
MSQSRPPVEPAPGATKLYVGQIPASGSIRDLEDLFAKYGRVLHIEIKPAGFGFIEYDDPRDAEDAVKALHEHPFEGQRLVVEFSKRASANNSTCFICGQTGHWVRDCPDNRDKGMDVSPHKSRYGGRDRSPARYRSRSRSPRRRSPSPYGDRRGGGGHHRDYSHRDYSPHRSDRHRDRSPPPRSSRYDDPPRRDHHDRDDRRPASPR